VKKYHDEPIDKPGAAIAARQAVACENVINNVNWRFALHREQYMCIKLKNIKFWETKINV